MRDRKFVLASAVVGTPTGRAKQDHANAASSAPRGSWTEFEFEFALPSSASSPADSVRRRPRGARVRAFDRSTGGARKPRYRPSRQSTF